MGLLLAARAEGLSGQAQAAGWKANEVNKGTRGMPRLSEAKKDVISCDKAGGGAHSR